jgi:protein SCO1/2
MKWSIGREFEVVSVSINPRETPTLAAAKKRSYVQRYGRSGTAQGWHFLTGSEPAIRQLAEEVGFRYVYDSVSRQYAHPSGVIILTPSGQISGYLFGVSYRPKELFESLRRAGSNQVSSPIQQFILLCFRYNPITGKYSGIILNTVRVLSVGTLLGLVCLIVALARRSHGAKATTSIGKVSVAPPEHAPSEKHTAMSGAGDQSALLDQTSS